MILKVVIAFTRANMLAFVASIWPLAQESGRRRRQRRSGRAA
jgi:hypothetical protein